MLDKNLNPECRKLLILFFAKGFKKKLANFVSRSSFQRRIQGIPDLIPKENNVWPVRMPLRMSQISRPPLVNRKSVRKPKK